MSISTPPSTSATFDPDHYRMLVVDLDGTALDGDGTINDADARAARALQEQGVIVTIATGRLFGGTQPHAAALGVEGHLACMNGAEVISAGDGRVISGNYLPNAVAMDVRDRLREHKLATSLFSSWEIHHGTSSLPYRHFLQTWSTHFRDWKDVCLSPAWEADPRLLAVVSAGPLAQIRAVAESLDARVDHERYEILAFPAWSNSGADDEHGVFMFRDRREDKGRALQGLARAAGIDEDQVVCVGDWINDVPMMNTNALSFAMDGSPDWLQDAADHVTETHKDEGGVIAELARRVWGV